MAKIMGLMVALAVVFVGVILFFVKYQTVRDRSTDVVTSADSSGVSGGGGHSFRLVAASADGRFIAGLSEPDRSVYVWHVGTGELLKTFHYEGDYFPSRINDAPRESLCFSRDGTRLVFKGYNQEFITWNLENGMASTGSAGDKVAISPDAAVVAGLDFIHLTVKNLETGETVREVSFDSPTEINKFIVSPDHQYLMGEG